MTARTAKDYLASLKDNRRVWIGNEAINVLEYAPFKGSLDGMAGYFDWQNKYADECLVEDPETGAPMNASLLVPRTAEDLAARHRAYEQLARYSYGMLGRTPDYCNTALAGQVARKDIFEPGDMKLYENLKRFHREVIDKDLSLTHTIINADIDRAVDQTVGLNAELGLKVVDRTRNGLVVRGAKVLATLGPFANEIYVYPSRPVQKGGEEFALSFAIPMDTKGLITLCRDHYGTPSSVADQPFSARFDEQDAFMIFDDVEIPWERVFIDGNLDVHNAIAPAVFRGNMAQQVSVRAKVKLEFAYDLCNEIARITNSDKYPPVAQMLGEIYSYLILTRAMIHSAEMRAYDWGAGAFFPHGDLNIIRTVMPGWMIRINEIIQILGGHNLLCTPELSAFENPEIGTLLKKYLPGVNGITAEDRARIMRTAWDFAGSALGNRVELYERYYLGSVARNQVTDQMGAQRNESWGQVKRYLSELD